MMMSSGSDSGSGSGCGEGGDIGWEKRPGGMLVQTGRSDYVSPLPRLIRVRVSYGAARYDVSVASQATFGELKKLLTAETGLQTAEQRLLYKGKERGNSEFLDMCGLKDRSKLVLMEDPASLEKRYIEMRRNAKMESTRRAISAVSLEVDKLSDQVTTIEKSISSGNKVPEVQITTLIELLMRQAVKLDNMTTEGDTASQKNIQAKRVQKCVETLDVLKITNSRVKPVVVTTKWETFEPQPTTQWEFFE
ncbi:BAG family molecular chaperone regulator 1-like [Dioscorea cayenensis subsp. rotundata]|uniref:BAG family molecular chaperone regulator 1-like n=1 Tax=Dioscorea cayennensis subsp. rotundata TaxID=55577 RepID=A0AB40AGC4_DIOCR|nr:BAG family molecular chaperone regulator 1-like [Dioscorea cayenensis subsp. rotundata]